MANNKKIFTIEINGLTESVKSVDALQEKIMDLEKRIKSLCKSGGGGKKVLLEVDGDAEYNKLLAERQKLLKAVKTEMGNTNKNAKEYKQETKEMVALLEKERNATNGYANTLKGLKQELKDCKEEIQNIDFKSEHYQEVEERIASITDKLKEYEAKQKTFSRNVGNYPGKEIEQSSYEKVKELYNNLKQLNPVIDEIESKIKNNESIDFNWFKNVISEEDLNALVQLQDRMAKTSVGVTSEMHRMQQQGLKPITDGFKRLN
jgi:DNA repair exonuclease SbcCD ATPase subunit